MATKKKSAATLAVIQVASKDRDRFLALATAENAVKRALWSLIESEYPAMRTGKWQFNMGTMTFIQISTGE